MLGKLLKYEYKATARIFLPFYLGIIILSFLTGFQDFYVDEPSSISAAIFITIFPTLLVISFVGLMVLTLIMVIKRFDSNLLSDEGYLMFTLPVKITQLINAKLIISILWSILTGIVFILSMLLVFRRGFDFTAELYDALWEFFSLKYASTNTLYFILVSILSYANFLLMVYVSLSISQAYGITKSRILGGILVYIGLSIVFSVVNSFFMVVASIGLDESLEFMIERTFENGNLFSLLPILYLVYLLAKNAVLYYLTFYHMKYKLNLD